MGLSTYQRGRKRQLILRSWCPALPPPPRLPGAPPSPLPPVFLVPPPSRQFAWCTPSGPTPRPLPLVSPSRVCLHSAQPTGDGYRLSMERNLGDFLWDGAKDGLRRDGWKEQ
ncbi:hypothetical protein RRG08_032560 [Elysia crispata]|uniref:Uncharacterized protein n=1 Tax=Elysia crispata TaxID=231223 RepID=A0AAE0ZY70_9GAST|nr:hypothetical protein RRG08_032560 [Elysia crispata]